MYPNGEVSQALDRLQPGDKIALKGPFGKFVYKAGKYKAIGAAPPPPPLGDHKPYSLRVQKLLQHAALA